MLNEQLQIELDQEAKAEAKKLTGRVPIFRMGYEAGHYDGAAKYAEKWQQAQQRAERYEKALKAIVSHIAYLQRKAVDEGAILDGQMAQYLAP